MFRSTEPSSRRMAWSAPEGSTNTIIISWNNGRRTNLIDQPKPSRRASAPCCSPVNCDLMSFGIASIPIRRSFPIIKSAPPFQKPVFKSAIGRGRRYLWRQRGARSDWRRLPSPSPLRNPIILIETRRVQRNSVWCSGGRSRGMLSGSLNRRMPITSELSRMLWRCPKIYAFSNRRLVFR